MFKIQLLLSFFFGGLFIALQTLAGEHVKGFWRNLVLVIPTTFALGMLFIGITKSPADVYHAALIGPAALTPDYLFVAVFALTAVYGLILAFVFSLISWALSAFLLISFPPENYFTSIFVYAIPFLIVFYLFLRKLPQEELTKKHPFNFKHIIGRAIFGGSIISLAVYLAKTMGNEWGGLFASYPASFTSTLLIYYKLHGKNVIPSIAKALFFPGIFGFITYTFVSGMAIPQYDVWIGTLIAYAATFLIYLMYYFVQKTVRKINCEPT